jgi:hypothetical protein
MMDVFRGDRVSTPFFDIESKEGLISMCFRLNKEVLKVLLEILRQMFVEFFAEKVSYRDRERKRSRVSPRFIYILEAGNTRGISSLPPLCAPDPIFAEVCGRPIAFCDVQKL